MRSCSPRLGRFDSAPLRSHSPRRTLSRRVLDLKEAPTWTTTLDLRLTRGAALRLAAAGAAGLALGVRSARQRRSHRWTMSKPPRAHSSRRCRGPSAPGRRFRSEAPSARAGTGRCPARCRGTGFHSDRCRSTATGRTRLAPGEHVATGYSKALDIMSLQGVLKRMSTGIDDPFDADRYFVSVFGRPGNRAWGWRPEGHHLSRNFTIVGDTLVTEPFSWALGRPTPAPRIEHRARRTGDAARGGRGKRDRALRRRPAPAARRVLPGVADRPRHPECRPGEAARPRGRPRPRPPVRRAKARARDRAHVCREPPRGDCAASARSRRAGRHGPHPLRWAGSLRPGQPHYYRLQGPTFLLEFDNSRNSGTHIHSVWRDFDATTAATCSDARSPAGRPEKVRSEAPRLGRFDSCAAPVYAPVPCRRTPESFSFGTVRSVVSRRQAHRAD